MSIDFMRLRELFLNALERHAPDEWPAYLAGACAQEPELHREVALLLKAHAEQEGLLDREAVASTPLDTARRVVEGPGSLIGPYRLLEQIGEGGMGVVFRAEQSRPIRRQVALKIIKPGMDCRRVVARFRAERQAQALMDHTHIARVFDAGETESGRPFVVLELVEGVRITHYCDQRRLPLRERLSLFLDVCDAVQHAHQKGIIHCDLTAANVLVTDVGGGPVPKVIDFGVARAVSLQLTEQTLLTDAGTIVGTLESLSPEQAELSQRDIDTRCDLYALGVLLYELLTGTTPFERQRLQRLSLLAALRVIREEEPPAPSQRLRSVNEQESIDRGLDPRVTRPQLRGELDSIVLKCLEKEPRRRYGSAAILAEDVRHWLEGKPVTAGPNSAWRRSVKWARRRPLVALLSLLLVASTLLGGMGIAWRGWQVAQANRRIAGSLYLQSVALAERELSANNVARALELLRGCPQTLRGWEWRVLERMCHEPVATLPARSGPLFGVAYSADGEWLAAAGFDGTITLWEASTQRRLRTLTGHRVPVRDLAFSANGRWLASVGGGQSPEVPLQGELQLWDLTGDAPPRELARPAASLWCVAVNPQGTRIAFGGGGLGVDSDGYLAVCELDSGALVWTRPPARGRIFGLAFSPDGTKLAAAGEDCQVRILDAATGKDLSVLPHANPVFCVAFSPDPEGRFLATAGGAHARGDTGELRVWETGTGRLVHRLAGHSDEVWSVVYSPDGRRIASASFDRTVKVWDPATGEETLTLRGHADHVRGLAFSPDGQRLASASEDQTVRVHEATPWMSPSRGAGPTARLTGHTDRVWCVAFSPDGTRLLSASEDRTLRCWDVANRSLTTTLQGHAAGVHGVAFHPAGTMWLSGGDDGSVRLWEQDQPKPREIIDSNAGWLQGVAWSPRGTDIAWTSDYTVRIRGAGATDSVRTLPGHRWVVSALAFHPRGTHLATGSWDQSVRIHDVTGDEAAIVLRGHEGRVQSLAYSADGSRLASAGNDATVRIWDSTTGQELHVLRGHGDKVLSVAFGPTRQLLASAGDDQTVRLWNGDTGEEWRVLRGLALPVRCVALSPDGTTLAVGTGEVGRGEIELWDLTGFLESPAEEAAP